MKINSAEKWLWETLMSFLFCHSHNSLNHKIRPALGMLSVKPPPTKLNEIPASLTGFEIHPSLRLYSAVSLFFFFSYSQLSSQSKLDISCTCDHHGHLGNCRCLFLPFKRVALGLVALASYLVALASYFILGGSLSVLQNARFSVLSSLYWFSAHVCYELLHRLLTWTCFWQRMHFPMMHSNTRAQMKYCPWFS